MKPRILLICFLLAAPALGWERLQAVDPDWVAAHAERLRGLFQALDPAAAGMAPVTEAARAGRLVEAAEALLRHYREKPLDGAPFLYNAQEDLPLSPEIPAAILEDTFFVQGLLARQRRTPEGGIDWNYFGPREDKEWAWMMNRHLFFYQLVHAFEETGDPAYIRRLDALLRDWVLHNPSPDRLNFTPAWRALEAARRILDSWVWTFYTLRAVPEFSDEARLLLLSSLPDHARMLKRFPSFWGGNHLLTEKIALGQLAVAFPEFRAAPEWLEHARYVVRENIMEQVYEDGGYKELSFHYHRIVAKNLMLFLRLLEFGGAADADPELFRRGAAMWDYMLKVTRPNGFGPLNNDSDYESIRIPRFRALLGNDARPDWLYLVSGGYAGRPPGERPTRHWPWSGHVVFRDHWREDALWAFFDIGPYGTAHHQHDRLHLSVSAFGVDFLVDAGRYTYKPGPWRDYFRGHAGHNVVLLDGQGALPGPPEVHKPMPATFFQSPQYAFASAEARFSGSRGSHRRSVFFRPGEYWVVLDEVRTFGPRDLEVLWHIHPGRSVEQHGAAVRIGSEAGTLVLVPLLEGDWELEVLNGRETPTPRGWYSPNFNVRQPAPQLVFSHRGNGPATLGWLLVPVSDRQRRMAEADPARLWDQLVLAPGALALEVLLPSGERDALRLSFDGVDEFSVRR